MKKSLLGLVSSLLLLGSSAAMAQGPGWTATSKVDKLVTTIGGHINISLSPGLTGCESYSGYGETFATLYKDHLGFESIQSQLLTAQVTGKSVSIYFSDDKCKVYEVILHND